MYKLIGCIVIYNTKFDEINKLLSEFFKENIQQKLVIVDNSNTGYLKEKIHTLYPLVDYILSKNYGYGKGNNIAINKYKGKGKYFLAMNPDIFIFFEDIKKLIHYGDEKENFGIIMPNILSKDKELQYLCKLLPNPMNLFSRRFLKSVPYFKRINYKYELRFLSYKEEIIIPVLSGCFMFCNYDNLLREKGFDERFFMYMEDVDLSRKMYKYGNYFYPEVSIIHLHKKESFKSLIMTFQHIKSGIKYFNKWGWFYDPERRITNNFILKKYNYHSD